MFRAGIIHARYIVHANGQRPRLNYNPRFYVVSRVIVVELLKFLASASYREKGETERSERQRGRVLARAGNPPATHLNCKWPERFSVPPSDRMKLFRETPLELASSSLRVSVCVRASSLLSSSLLSLVIRRPPEAFELPKSFLNRPFLLVLPGF